MTAIYPLPRLLIFVALASIFGKLLAQDIAPMTWHETLRSDQSMYRSDWINVKNSPRLTQHAVGDGVTDDTAAIQEALNLVSSYITNRPTTVYLPAGEYRITETLKWKSSITGTYYPYGSTLIGCGSDTVIVWDGATDGKMFQSDGNAYSRFIGLVWDGKDTAAYGIYQAAYLVYEGGVRHENEAFYNFTASGIFAGEAGGSPSADSYVWNCLFVDCAVGIIEGGPSSNNSVMWQIRGCRFEDCGVGIRSPKGMPIILDCNFLRSTEADIYSSISSHVRRCTSVGSAMFFKQRQGASSSTVIQDCWVDSWTNTATGQNSGAITLGCYGTALIFDCKFTNAPNGNPPINLINYPYSLLEVMTSANYCPTISTLVQTGAGGGGATTSVLDIPRWGDFWPSTVTSIANPYEDFLSSTPVNDAASVLDVTQSPYNASKFGAIDATAAIQQAIDDAASAADGTVVYIPAGLYKITSTLNVTGSNYKIEGAGWRTQLIWYGSSNSTIFAVSSPQDISLEQFQAKVITTDETVASFTVTSSVAANLVMDGIYCTGYNNGNPGAGAYNTGAPGILLSSLPAGSTVFMQYCFGPLTVHDCGKARIFGDVYMGGRYIIDGASQVKTGFLGLLMAEGGQKKNDTDYQDILVKDHQDFIIGSYWVEQTFHHLKLEGGSPSWDGRVTIQGFNQSADDRNTDPNFICKLIESSDYRGRVMYGPHSFNNIHPSTINLSGTNAMDLSFPLNKIKKIAPTVSTSGNAHFIRSQNMADIITAGAVGVPITDEPNPLSADDLFSIAQGLDHLRQLGWEDLYIHDGLYSSLYNPSTEHDVPNPLPTEAPGGNYYTPAKWTVTNQLSTASGARNFTCMVGASPFGPGIQSFLWVDATASTTGSSLSVTQPFSSTPIDQGVVLSFDFKMNSTADESDIWIWLLNGPNAASGVHLTSNGSTCYLGAGVNSSDTLLTHPDIDTWYRVQVAVKGPAQGAQDATLYLTPWTASGLGTTSSYAISGVKTGFDKGFSRFSMYSGKGPGANQSINLDNFTLIVGDPLAN